MADDDLTTRLREEPGRNEGPTMDDCREAAARIEALEAELASYRENFPCDGGCNPNSGPAEECSLHGRGPSDLWQIIGRVMAERDARDTVIAEALAWFNRSPREYDSPLERKVRDILSRVPQGAASQWSGNRAFAADEVLAQGAAEPLDPAHGGRFKHPDPFHPAEPWTDPEPYIVQGDGWEQRLAHPDDNESKHTPRLDPRSREQWEAEQ